MRTFAASFLGLVTVTTMLVGCVVEDRGASWDDARDGASPQTYDDGREEDTVPGPSATATPRKGEVQGIAPAGEDTHAEVVYVFMRDRQQDGWMCTGTLVDARTVVTAAHCLEPAKFVAYEVVAPLAPGRPRVTATSPRVFGGSYEDVANPDIGTLTLLRGIELPTYAELTDVTDRLEAGEALSVAAVVRADERAEAPLVTTDPMPLSSTVPYGYAHGFGTPMFSKGGDSGAGLFLVEDGRVTHKLVGVGRQPEPDRGIDHFTRIDAAFTSWFASTTTR